jgi:uncharacterized protein YecT (DUF1311 family)
MLQGWMWNHAEGCASHTLDCNHPTTETGNMTYDHDTPRTDAELNKTWKGIHAAFVPMSFAKQLERELIELQQQQRNCLEIVDDDAKEMVELKAEIERLRAILKDHATFLRKNGFDAQAETLDPK